jgi:hypothetical protein
MATNVEYLISELHFEKNNFKYKDLTGFKNLLGL